MSIPYRDFDLNDLNTPKPWAPRETQAWEDVLDTLMGDTLTGVKEVAGHRHNKIYSPVGVAGIEIGAAGDAQILSLTTTGVVTNLATGSLGTVPELPIVLGGTNSGAPLNNGRVMVSNGSAIVEGSALEADLHSHANKAVLDGISSGDVINWDAAYTHSQIAGGNSVHVSTTENTQWDAAYTHSQIAGGNSVHVSGTENTQWDAAYSHSTVTTGNPHSISYTDLAGNPSDRITAGTNISWAGDTLNVSASGVTTFLALTDTIPSFTANRILFTSGSDVVDSANLTWNDSINRLVVKGNGAQFGDTGYIAGTGSGTAGAMFVTRNAYWDGTNWRRLVAENDIVSAYMSGGPVSRFGIGFEADAGSAVDSIISIGGDSLTVRKASVIVNDASRNDCVFQVKGATNPLLINTNALRDTVGIGMAADASLTKMLLSLGFPTEELYLMDVISSNPGVNNNFKWVKVRTSTSGSISYYIRIWQV